MENLENLPKLETFTFNIHTEEKYYRLDSNDFE